jgi:holliday junction DNA helicase RuvA
MPIFVKPFLGFRIKPTKLYTLYKISYDWAMISYIQGEIIDFTDKHATLLVGGLGYKVFVTKSALPDLNIGAKLEFFCHLAVRETALDLYGFLDKKERDFFELLITISGIGPKSAMGILDVADPETLHKAVSSGDTSHLTQVSGIGKKNAEKIVRELSSKIEKLENVSGSAPSADVDVLEALMSLGYSQHEARKSLQSIPKDIADTEEKIKYALKEIGK